MTEFEEELLNDIALRAFGDSSFQLQAFADELGERLESAEVVFDICMEPLSCIGRRGKSLQILGYADDSAADSLIVFVGQHFEDTGATLNLTDAKRIFSSGESFIEHCFDGWLNSNLEASSREAEHAEYFATLMKRVTKIHFILITNGKKSSRIKTIANSIICGITSSYSIWDIARFEDLSLSENGHEDIHVDFSRWLPEGLPCLVGAENHDRPRSYLAVVPAQILADVFFEHGSRLLESNVRTFLSARGGVNKGIQYTLTHEPELFLAYNNGLTTTATSVEITSTGERSAVISSVENWQIVNGGQTTSSLAHFIKLQNGRSLDEVYVQMKLVTVNSETSSDVVSNISRYANSQNKVNEADFFSNSPYHVRLENISRRLKAPAQEGEQFQTRWFYERTRGQYENTRNSGTAADKRKFDLEFPKAQKISKTDWAKYAACWDQNPHQVSKGAQSNFAAFAVVAESRWKADPDAIGDAYFRKGIAHALMFEQLKAAVVQADWYRPGYLANIVAYAISKFSFELGRQFPQHAFDFESIWERQRVSEESLRVLVDAAQIVHGVLTDPERLQTNVTQWAKQQVCWDSAKAIPMLVPEDVVKDLMSISGERNQHAEARKQRQMDTGFENIKRVLDVAPQIWRQVLDLGPKNGMISPTERDIIHKVTGRSLVPTEAQANRMILALARCAENSLIAHSDF